MLLIKGILGSVAQSQTKYTKEIIERGSAAIS